MIGKKTRPKGIVFGTNRIKKECDNLQSHSFFIANVANYLV